MTHLGNFYMLDNTEGIDRTHDKYDKAETVTPCEKEKLTRYDHNSGSDVSVNEPEGKEKEKLSASPYTFHWDGNPTHNTDWDPPASPTTHKLILHR